MNSRTLTLLALATLSLPAAAKNKKDGDDNKKTVDDFKLSVTVAPMRLVLPELKVTGEYKVADKVGVALSGGYGKFRIPGSDDVDLRIIEAAGQGRYYVGGDFKTGMLLGAEAYMFRLSTAVEEGDIEASASGTWVRVGPIIGFKHIANAGFTMDTQFGYGFGTLLAKAEASSGGQTAEVSDSTSANGVIFNLNLGWSF